MRVASFDYRDSGFEVRPDLPEAYREIWHKIGDYGNWWTGRQRIAIVAESRASEACRLCAARRASLSPFAVSGEHDIARPDLLPASAIDAVHRISTDAARLTKGWLEDLLTPNFGYGHYIELLGVLVPDAVRMLFRLSGVQYLTLPGFMRFGDLPGRALTRSQVELVAARVSALNDCFY